MFFLYMFSTTSSVPIAIMQITPRTASKNTQHIHVSAVPNRLSEFAVEPFVASPPSFRLVDIPTPNDLVSSKILATAIMMETLIKLVAGLPNCVDMHHYRNDYVESTKHAFRVFLELDDRLLLLTVVWDSNPNCISVTGSIIAFKGDDIVDSIELATCSSAEARDWIVTKAGSFLLQSVPQEASI